MLVGRSKVYVVRLVQGHTEVREGGEDHLFCGGLPFYGTLVFIPNLKDSFFDGGHNDNVRWLLERTRDSI